MTILNIDFETRSTVKLKETGVYPYAQHPTTDIWCMAYAFGDEEVQLWVPGLPIPARVVKHIVEEFGELRAWNAQFERIIWRHILTPVYGFPKPALEQFVCTAAEAAAMALPRGLDQAARVLKVDHKKDSQGYSLMLRMSRPRSTKGGATVWWTDQARLDRLYEYCKQDVRAERAVGKRVRRLSEHERSLYLLDQRINDRGLRLDVPLIKASKKLVTRALSEANDLISTLTEDAVSKVTKVADLTRWLQYRGLDTENVTKSTVRELLEGDLPSRERRVLEIRADTGRTSVAKLDKMLATRGVDDYARGLLLYHGASTGRWTGKLIQPQNLTKSEIPDVEDYIPLILAGKYEEIDSQHPVLVIISSLMRGMFRSSPGCRFMSADFSQIEARVLAWIAGQQDLVDAFTKGAKVYERMAARIYGKKVSEIANPSKQRDVGKTVILGAGFQMGPAKFKKQLKEQTGIEISDEEAETIIGAYRAMNDCIKGFWPKIERAARTAVLHPGRVTHCGRDGMIRYVVRGEWLWCLLPSNRPLAYALPRVVDREAPWGEMKPQVRYMGISSYTRKWGPRYAYGGLLTENIVQAMARDLMAASMLRVEATGYPIALTVHDEIVADVRNDHGSLQEFTDLMKRKPRWAEGCSVAVAGWEGERYRK